MNPNLMNPINRYKSRHEAFLETFIEQLKVPAPQIQKAIAYTLFPGGKRIRPLFTYLIGQLIDIDLKILDVLAAAIELTHCYSLIHDDLPAMDDDDFRRGKPSCHKAFDEATAILVGDGMQALAVELLLTQLPGFLPAEQVLNITLELIKASGINGMVSGQSLDLSELSNATVHEDQLKNIHHLKTGCLIRACATMPIAATNTPDEPIKNALVKYAAHIGLVFQMQDDYLDQYAQPEFLGKRRSSDLANQKTTFATLYKKEALTKKIDEHYQIAFEALQLFGDKARDLIELTKTLQKRQ